MIRKRLETYDRDTKPVLWYYPAEKIVRVEATQSQIRVLSQLVEVLVPLKEDHDRGREAAQAGAASKLPAGAVGGVGDGAEYSHRRFQISN